MGRSAGLVLILSAGGCATADPLPNELSVFRYEGKPIHPAIIDDFIPWPSDGEPVIAAIDLEGYTRSRNRLCGWTVKELNGRVEGDREGNGGSLWYWHLGQVESGSHFVEVLDCGGGSASWRYLVQLRFEEVEAFGSRRILLRCENVEDLSCCPVRVVEGRVVYGPCDTHPRPIPDAEPPDVAKAGPSLADPVLLRTWDSYVARENLRLGKIRVFPHSIFVERQGSVRFTVVEATDGKCLLHLATDVDSCRFLLIDARTSLIPESNSLRFSFHEFLEEGREAFTNGTRSGSNWSLADESSD